MNSKKTLKMIKALNLSTIQLMMEDNNISLVKYFTNECIKFLDADFGLVFGKFNVKDIYKLVYKSPNTPFEPVIPKRKKNNSSNYREDSLIFDPDVKKGNYDTNISHYLKSYIIIPVSYGDHVYGNIILCYKKRHNFSDEELALAETIRNTVAQAVTINWMLEKEQNTLFLAEKQKEMEVLLAQEKLKTEFIANATHELRTPLAIMKGNVDLALSDKENLKAAQGALSAVNTEIGILSEILKDLALLTATEQNTKNILHRTPLNLKDLIDGTIKRLRVTANERKINFEVDNDADLFVSGDKEYLEKIFLNLIKNAITYGRDNGKIKIKTRRGKKAAKIEISDNGVGVSKEDLPKIFERFYRVDKSHSSKGTHSGLGLSIVKWATEVHGGTVDVKSTINKGSTFTVTLPLLPLLNKKN